MRQDILYHQTINKSIDIIYFENNFFAASFIDPPVRNDCRKLSLDWNKLYCDNFLCGNGNRTLAVADYNLAFTILSEV